MNFKKSKALLGSIIGILSGLLLNVLVFHTSYLLICICAFAGIFIGAVFDETAFIKDQLNKLPRNRDTDSKATKLK